MNLERAESIGGLSIGRESVSRGWKKRRRRCSSCSGGGGGAK